MQTPRIPIWACEAWTPKKAAFRRAARWDGVVAIANPNQNWAIQPEEIRAIKAYIGQRRPNDDPFDIVVILWSECGRTPQEMQEIAKYSQAGATWWLEDLSLERFSSLEEVHARLQK